MGTAAQSEAPLWHSSRTEVASEAAEIHEIKRTLKSSPLDYRPRSILRGPAATATRGNTSEEGGEETAEGITPNAEQKVRSVQPLHAQRVA